MSYSWAIALVILVAAMLFLFGVFDTSAFMGTKSSGFSGVGVSGWQMTSDGTFSLKFTNRVGQRINITGVGITVKSAQATITPARTLAIGETSNTTTTSAGALGAMSPGSGYIATVVINYTDLNSGFAASTKGTLTGKVISLAKFGESCAALPCAGGYGCNASFICQRTINLSIISGVTVPLAGATPVTSITNTSQYTGVVTWSPANNPFALSTIYTASINITPKSNYTLAGVASNFFTVANTTAVSNPANSGVVTAVFPATSQCLANMSYIPKLGGYCIDQYEASMPGGLGTAARSVPGVYPKTTINQSNAQAACVVAGKYLCTSAQWLGAADIKGAYYNLPTNLGTSNGCRVNSASATTTGSAPNCRSEYYVYDMIGNVREWNSETVTTTGSSPSYPSDAGWTGIPNDKFGGDYVAFVSGTNVTNLAVIRGGAFDYAATAGPFNVGLLDRPSSASNYIGFRCCSGSNRGYGISSIVSVSDAYAGFTTVN